MTDPRKIDRYFELKILIKDIDRRIELAKMNQSELLDAMDENDGKFFDDMDWLEKL